MEREWKTNKQGHVHQELEEGRRVVKDIRWQWGEGGLMEL